MSWYCWGFHVPETSETSNNSKPSLQNTQSCFNVLSARLLGFEKLSLLLCWWIWYGLDKNRPRRISSIDKIVAHCVGISIDCAVASQSISTCKCSKKMRPLLDINVIEIWENPGGRNNAKSIIHLMLQPQAQLLDHGSFWCIVCAMLQGSSSLFNAYNLCYQTWWAILFSHWSINLLVSSSLGARTY
jgi:hypothetical protein